MSSWNELVYIDLKFIAYREGPHVNHFRYQRFLREEGRPTTPAIDSSATFFASSRRSDPQRSFSKMSQGCLANQMDDCSLVCSISFSISGIGLITQSSMRQTTEFLSIDVVLSLLER